MPCCENESSREIKMHRFVREEVKKKAKRDKTDKKGEGECVRE